MKTRRMLWICGGATLFAFAACEAQSELADAATSPTADAKPVSDAPDGLPSDALAADPAIGAPCEPHGQLWCLEDGTQVGCWDRGDGKGLTWDVETPSPDGVICYCSAGHPGPADGCISPGFVGLDRTGRVRKAPPLRARTRAASLGHAVGRPVHRTATRAADLA